MSKQRFRSGNRVFRPRVSMARTSIAAAVAAAIAAPSAVWAQSADATLQGVAAPNSEIVARNKDSGITRKTTARADGSYALLGLPPGAYTITSGKNSFDVVLTVATTSSLDLTGALEEVIIRGQRLVETRTSEVSGVVTAREIESVPQITRNFLEFADSIPGVQFTVNGNGNTSLRGGAMVAGTVNVYIDGIGMKDFVAGGVSGQAGGGLQPDVGGPGNPFPQSAIDQYKVITSNYKAEFDQLSSTAIVAQTKSGTNTFSGDAFANYTNQNMRGLTPSEAKAGKQQDGKTYEYGASVGGPIITDQLHFFATLENKSLQLPNTVFPAPSSGLTLSQAQAKLPPGVGSQFGPTSNPFKETLFFAKLDWEPTANDRLELWDLYRHETSVAGAAGQTAASAASQVTNKNQRANLRWQHFADGWTNDLSLSYQSASSGSSPSSQDPRYTYNYITNTGLQQLIAVGGSGPGDVHNESQKGITLSEVLTWSDLEFAGRHTVKAGFKHSSLNFGSQVQGQGVAYKYAVTAAGTDPTPYEAYYSPSTGSFGSPSQSYGDHQYGLFAQDDWQITPRLQANIGLRWDYDALDFWANHITPSILTDALKAPYPTAGGGQPGESYAAALALGGININDYISSGSNRKPPTSNFQPRLGLSFDLNGDQQHVIFGGWGRSYDINEFQKLAFESTKTANGVTANFNDPLYAGSCAVVGSNGCLAWNQNYSTLAGIQALSQNAFFSELDVVNNHIKMPYSDQFTIGMRNRIGGWNTSVAVSEVDSYNRLVGWLGFRNAAGGYLANCGWGTSDGYAPAWCDGKYKPQGFPPGANANLVLWDNAGRDKNTQVLISAEKPYTKESGWTLHFAYTYSNARVSDDYSYSGGNLYQFDFATPYAFPMLSSPVVARHRLVTTGSIDGPWGLTFSGKLTLATPIGAVFSTGCGSVTQCNGGSTNPRDWNNWLIAGAGRPSGTLGEHNLDIAITENWHFSELTKAYLRLDILNVTNTAVWDPGAESVNWPTGGSPTVKYNKDGGPINGVPRTLKLTVGFNW